jgi:hypothetical protein
MLKYLSKLAMDILPSVVATIIGAYIVNHYIVAKPGPEAPAAAAVSSAEPSKPDTSKPDIRPDAKAAETPAEVGNIPRAGVRARGISEKAVFDKTIAERSAEKPAEKSSEKSEERPAETASIPADARRRPTMSRERTAAKTVPVTAPPVLQPAASAAVATPVTAPPIEAAVAPEDRRDANDLARAAIERLRGGNDGAPHPQEAARIPEPPRVVSAPRASIPQEPAVRPLPPPIMVSTPPSEAFGSAAGPSQPQQSNSGSVRVDDPHRPTPPADIPSAAPFDLRAESAGPPAREQGNVAQDMLSAAKSVFHAVLPQ